MKYLGYVIGTVALLICWVIALGYCILRVVADTALGTAWQIYRLWQGK